MSIRDRANAKPRRLRVAETIRRLLSEIFRKHDFNSVAISTLSVQSVDISKDLKYANVYIYPLITSRDKESFDKESKVRQDEVIDLLNVNSFKIGRILGSQLTTKYTPKLRFYIDPSVDQANTIEQLIETTKSKRQPTEE